MTVPEVTRAANAAVQHAFAAQADVNAAPTAELPLGPADRVADGQPDCRDGEPRERARHQRRSTLPNTVIYTPAGTKVPQRANVMITAGMALPGFEGRLRGFRMYEPEADATRPYGWAFVTAGTRLVGVDAARARPAQHLHDAADRRHGRAQRGQRRPARALSDVD